MQPIAKSSGRNIHIFLFSIPLTLNLICNPKINISTYDRNIMNNEASKRF